MLKCEQQDTIQIQQYPIKIVQNLICTHVTVYQE